MNVGELIEFLKRQPKSTPVVVWSSGDVRRITSAAGPVPESNTVCIWFDESRA